VLYWYKNFGDSMAYGLQINGFDFTYGVYSVIQKGTLYNTVIVDKADHPDISQWSTVFVPVGVRDITRNELRPTTQYINNTIVMTPPASGLAHLYFVLGR
jgi:hypothetical protein